MVITEQQLAERVNYLGGSDCAKILGLSRWGTPLSTFMAKVYPNRDDSENCIGGKNEASYWGNELEEKVCEAFTKVTGKKVARVNQTLKHPEHDFIRANIDRRVVGEDAILEAKTCSAYKAQDWVDDEIPEEYILQLQHYLAVTGNEVAYIAVLIGGQKFLWKRVERDEELINKIISAEVAFWNDFILTKQPPMPTGAEKDGDMLERLYPEAEAGVLVDLTPDCEELIDIRRAKKVEVKALELLVDEIDNKIKAQIGEAEGGRVGKFTITWRNQTQKRVDSKLLAAEYPDVFAKVQKENSFRKINISEAKAKKE